MGWEELTAAEREAALFLGYTSEFWCADGLCVEEKEAAFIPASDVPTEQTSPRTSSEPSAVASVTAETEQLSSEPSSATTVAADPLSLGMLWFDLSSDQRYALSVLACTEISWDGGMCTATLYAKSWEDLTETEQYGVSLLGYDTAESWDAAIPGGHLSFAAPM